MSLILDALKRAERERQPGQGIGLGDLPASRQSRGPRVHPRMIAGVVLLLLVAMGAWKLAHKARPAPAAAVPPPAQPAAQGPVVVTLPGQKPIVASPAPAPIPGTEGVASLDELAEGEPEPALVPAPAMTPELQPKPAKAQPRPAPAQKAAPTPAQTAPQPQPADATPPAGEAALPEEIPATEEPPPAAAPPPQAAPAQREIPPALTQPAPLRTFKEMPPEYRADFPALTIQVHVYEQMPSQRFVIVNGRRYRQGETMAEGPQIVEIVKDGMVLDYRGERLLYPISR